MKIAIKSQLHRSMINTLMAFLGLLILSKPTPVILSIGSNNPYMENTLTISTTLNPVTGSVLNIDA
jgi:hypothetical protein